MNGFSKMLDHKNIGYYITQFGSSCTLAKPTQKQNTASGSWRCQFVSNVIFDTAYWELLTWFTG